MSNQFKGSIGRTWEDSKAWWPQAAKAPADAPNIAYIILDDVGYGDERHIDPDAEAKIALKRQ
jgi:hypothetical protein